MAAKKRAAKKAPKSTGAPLSVERPEAGTKAAAPVEVEDAKAAQKGFQRGDRVQVLKGEYGNARGTIVGIDRMAVGVVLDNRVRQPAVPFVRENLKRC